MATGTSTFAILKVSPQTYNEVRTLLAANGYTDQFGEKNGQELINMTGIALQEQGGTLTRCGDCGYLGIAAGAQACPCCGATKQGET